MLRVSLAVLAAALVSHTPVVAAVATQSVFTSLDGDTFRISQTSDPDSAPNFYTASIVVDQATGIFAPLATLPTSFESDFTATRLGLEPQIQVRTYQVNDVFYTVNFYFKPNAFNYDFKNPFCESNAAAAQQAVTCFGPSQLSRVDVSFDTIAGGGQANLFYRQVTGTVISSPFVAAPPAVPELATWVMMIAGFGAVGFAMRQKAPTRISYVARLPSGALSEQCGRRA